MRLLLDECIPRKLKNSLLDYDCRTVPEVGLSGQTNGDLLDEAEKSGFHVFLTLDRGIEYQQALERRKIAIILIQSKSSRLADLLPRISEIQQALNSIKPGQLVRIG